MIPLINKDTITQRIASEYEYLQRNAIPLHDFELHARKISLLSFRLYVLFRAKVPLRSNSEY